MGQWVAALLSFGLLLAPRFTRFVASILAIVAAADILQHLYELLQQRARENDEERRSS